MKQGQNHPILPISGKKIEGKAIQTQPTIPDYSESATFDFENPLLHVQPLLQGNYPSPRRGTNAHRPASAGKWDSAVVVSTRAPTANSLKFIKHFGFFKWKTLYSGSLSNLRQCDRDTQ